MRITKLSVRNFRNIKAADFEFSPNVNIFVGNNAHGKTNLMEAISVCIGNSFRKSKFNQYIPFNSDEDVSIKLWFENDNYTESENLIEYTISKRKLNIKYNGLKVKDATQLYGVLKYVVFIPEHLNLIKGSPDLRRDYLDDVALMQTKTHWKKLSRYNRILKQKNILISKMPRTIDTQIALLQLEPWNEILAQEGLNVTYGRLKYFEFLQEYAAEIYSRMSDSRETLTMEYKSSVFGTEKPDFTQKDELFTKYTDTLKSAVESELRLGYTNCGIHRDDISFYINGNDAKDYGSQGQHRSVALALKLSEAEIIRRKNKSKPVVILDDVLSELDSIRRSFVLNNIENSQIFITCCNIDDLNTLCKGKRWRVIEGEFTEF